MSKPAIKGVVAAGHRRTAEAAEEILHAGGTAVDAAIAALVMACVCEPVLASPGGGGFAMVRDGSTGDISLIDFFPQTPLQRRQSGKTGVYKIIADFGAATQAFHIGPATSATPGFSSGIAMLHQKGGSIKLADLFLPAIKAARDGIKITPFQHYLATVVQPILTATPSASKLFTSQGEMLAVGNVFKNPGLADALELLAHSGTFDNKVARAIIDLQEQSGHLTSVDLSAYRAIERRPLALKLGASTVHLNPLPAASGALVAHSLDRLERPGAVELAGALRTTGRARHRAGSDLHKILVQPIRAKGTTHISVIDHHGNACALTTSNGEGNGELVGEFGFMLNNILGEEDVNPAGATGWPEDIRLSSMMCPSIIEHADGSIVALGTGGSNRIRSAIAQVVMRHCLEHMDLAQAVTAPRLHVEGDHLDFEDFFSAKHRQALCADFADHRAWPERNMFFGGVHAVRRAGDGQLSGVGDARRDGLIVIAG